MLNISSFLDRFKKIKDPKIEKEEIVALMSEVLGFEISSNSILIKNNTIFFSGGGAPRAEIFMKKDLILKALNEKMPKLYLKDIR